MTPLVASVTLALSWATVLLDAVILTAFALFITGGVRAIPGYSFLNAWAVPLAFAFSVISIASSLFYSEIAHFPPCLLCWWQRVLLFPQPIFWALLHYKKWIPLWKILLILSAAGALIAGYHTYIQFGGASIVPCTATGLSVSCEHRYFMELGYVTIPTMSLTTFLGLISLLVFARLHTAESKNS